MKKNCTVLSRMNDILLSVLDNDTWLRTSPSNKCENLLNTVIYLGWRGLDDDYISCTVREDILFAFEI